MGTTDKRVDDEVPTIGWWIEERGPTDDMNHVARLSTYCFVVAFINFVAAAFVYQQRVAVPKMINPEAYISPITWIACVANALIAIVALMLALQRPNRQSLALYRLCRQVTLFLSFTAFVLALLR